MNEQQAGLTLAEGVTRFHRAMSPLMRWDGWPVLDVRHLAYRRRPGKTLLAETDDVLGPLNEPATDYEDLRAGETLLSESFLSRVPAFDDEVVGARFKTAHDMLREAIAATDAVRPLARAAGDVGCFVHLAGKLGEALANRAMNVEEEFRGVGLTIEEAIAHEKDSAMDDVATSDTVENRTSVTLPNGSTMPDRTVTRKEAAQLLEASASAVRRWINRKRDRLDPVDHLGTNVSARFWLGDLRARQLAMSK